MRPSLFPLRTLTLVPTPLIEFLHPLPATRTPLPAPRTPPSPEPLPRTVALLPCGVDDPLLRVRVNNF